MYKVRAPNGAEMTLPVRQDQVEDWQECWAREDGSHLVIEADWPPLTDAHWDFIKYGKLPPTRKHKTLQTSVLDDVTIEEWQSMPVSKIAAKYGVSRSRVYAYIRTYDIPKMLGALNLSTIRNSEWAQFSNRQLAKMYNVSRARVGEYRDEHGKPRPEGHILDEVTDEQWMTMSSQEIAEMLGIEYDYSKTRQWMYEYRQANGVPEPTDAIIIPGRDSRKGVKPR